MDRAAVLAKFNDQLRRKPAAEAGSRVERDEHVTRVIAAGDGWSGVLWSDLAALGPAAPGRQIAAEVRRFAWAVRGSGSTTPTISPPICPVGWPRPDWPPNPPRHCWWRNRPAGPGRPAARRGGAGPGHQGRRGQPPWCGCTTRSSAVTTRRSARPSRRPCLAAASGSGRGRRRPETSRSRPAGGLPGRQRLRQLVGRRDLAGWRGRGVFRSLVACRARLARNGVTATCRSTSPPTAGPSCSAWASPSSPPPRRSPVPQGATSSLRHGGR